MTESIKVRGENLEGLTHSKCIAERKRLMEEMYREGITGSILELVMFGDMEQAMVATWHIGTEVDFLDEGGNKRKVNLDRGRAEFDSENKYHVNLFEVAVRDRKGAIMVENEFVPTTEEG